MRIRTQFFVNMLVFGSLVLVFAVSLLVIDRQIERLDRQEETAADIERAASDLRYLGNDYLLYRESQQRGRWEARFASLSDEVSSLNPDTPEVQASVNNIQENQQRLKAVFTDVVTAIEAMPPGQGASLDPFFQLAWSRLAVQNQGMFSEALRLSQMVHEAQDDLRQTQSRLILVLIGTFGAFLLTSYVLTYRRTIRSLTELQADTRVIGSGNLDHAIAVKRSDEIGELSQAFNQMAANLKNTMASKTELEEEIAERKKSEERANRQQAIQEGINRILEAALTCRTEEELGRACLAVAEQLTGSKFGFIDELNHQGRLNVSAISDPGWEQCKMDTSAGQGSPIHEMTVHGIYGRVLQDGKAFFTNDPSTHPDRIGTPEGHPPLMAFLGVPLTSGGKTLGVVGLGNREGGYRSEDQEAAESLAPAIVQAFERKRMEEELERSEVLLSEAERLSHTGAWEWDLASNQWTVSNEWLSIHGCQVIPVSPEDMLPLIHPEDRDKTRRHFAGVRGGEKPLPIEIRIIRQDTGDIRIINAYGELAFDTLGMPAKIIGVAQDITELRQAEAERERLLQQARRRTVEMNALLETMAEGVVIVDGEGRVVLFNGAAREMYGLSGQESAPRELDQFLKVEVSYPDGRPVPAEERPISRALRGEIFDQQEIVLSSPERERRLWASGSAVRDEAGKVVLAVVVFRDISQIREMEQQREEFISVTAHDLRNALTAIKGFADLISRPAMRDKLPSAALRAVDGITSGSRRLDRMISDLLDASRLEARRLTLEKRPIELVPYVRDVVQRSAELTKGYSVAVIETGGLQATVNLDPDRIEQVLTNLLSNAAKYSYPDTKITVELKQNSGDVVISVTNLGPGVVQEDYDKLFARFHRTRQAREENVPGLGLGLYIAKGLVEAHGGSIWVESTPGEYTTFLFTLPAA